MGNEINSLAQTVYGTTGPRTNEIYAQNTPDGLKIFNVKPGDQIRISNINGQKYLSINNQLVQSLDNTLTYPRIVISGTGLSHASIDIKGELGISTVVRLTDQNGKLQEEFVSKNEKPNEKTFVDKMVDSGIKGSLSPTKVMVEKEWNFY